MTYELKNINFNKYKQFVYFVKRDLWFLPIETLYFVLDYTLQAIHRKTIDIDYMSDDDLYKVYEEIIAEMNRRKEKEQKDNE